MRTAFSTSVREAGDLSAGVYDTKGRMIAQAITGTPGHVNRQSKTKAALILGSTGSSSPAIFATHLARGPAQFITREHEITSPESNLTSFTRFLFLSIFNETTRLFKYSTPLCLARILKPCINENASNVPSFLIPKLPPSRSSVSSLHQISGQMRKMFSYSIFGLFTFAVLEDVIDDLSEGFRLEWLSDLIYAKKGGMTVTSTIVLAVLLALLPLITRGKLKATVTRYRSDVTPGAQRRNSVMLFSIIAVLVIVLPWFLGGIINELLANVGLFLLLALGLNIVVGLAGLLDLGYVAFFAVGGYTTAVFTSPNSPWFSPETHFGISLLVVVVMAILAGLLIGAPVIRMRGDYLAIVTLGFGEIIRLLFLSDWLKPYLGGSQGITNIPPIDLGPWEVRGADPRSVFYMVLAFCVLAIYVSWRLQGSRLGRAWMAIREDESVAEVMGINTVNSKLMAFVVGAVLASFSGAVLAAKCRSKRSFMGNPSHTAGT